MADIIDRQAALDFKVSRGLNEDGILYVPYADVKKYLKQLPTAEPQMTDDTISRQAAIDLAKDICVPTKDGSIYRHRCIDPDAIRELPSVQPELKRGKWINDGGLYKCSYCNQLWAEWWAISKPIERMRKEMPYCPMCGSYNGEEN